MEAGVLDLDLLRSFVSVVDAGGFIYFHQERMRQSVL